MLDGLRLVVLYGDGGLVYAKHILDDGCADGYLLALLN